MVYKKMLLKVISTCEQAVTYAACVIGYPTPMDLLMDRVVMFQIVLLPEKSLSTFLTALNWFKGGFFPFPVQWRIDGIMN